MATTKISSAFRTRLESRKPTDLVRAILVFDRGVLSGSQPKSPATGRRTARSRQAQVRQVTESTSAAPLVARIDQLLQRHHAMRMSERLSPLGTLLVEAPAAAVLQFEREPLVRAVLEDQPVHSPTDDPRVQKSARRK